ncbi:hypothetical protein ACFXKK_03190 [Streptomyces globisporus]|uniref:hypothetical protein n=1 Tax=Streptomyces globisporus TaxID=1908 RepID=UPI003655E7DD
MVDLPSVLLAFTSTLAVTIYLVLVRRLSGLVSGLVASGLVTRRFVERTLSRQLALVEGRLRVSARYKTAWAIVCCMVGVGFYWWTWENGRLFADLAGGPNSTASFETVRRTWWASYETYPLLAAAWVVMGAVGVYFATKQAYIYTQLAQFAWQSRSLWRFQYVPRSRDDDFGWKPVGDVIGIVYVGFLNFTFSVTALLYLLRGNSQAYWNPVIAAFASVGTLTNATVVIALLWVMIRNHRATILGRRKQTSRALRRMEEGVRVRGRNTSRHVHATAQGVLLSEAPRWYPLKGWLKPVFSLLPAAIALSRLVLELRR